MGLMSKYKCPVCNKTVYYGLNVKSNTGEMLYIMHPACAEIIKQKSNNTIPPWPDLNEIKGILDGTIQRTCHEYRKRCNVCGKVYCYSDADIGKNLDTIVKAQRDAKMAVLHALGGTDVGLYANLHSSEQKLNSIVDFTKCPYCNSSDISDLSEDEFKNAVIVEANQQRQLLQQKSPVELIKEYKELLDSGIITQEDFDAKKKQLLGL